MKFTVMWTPVAEKELAELWLAADDNAEVTAVIGIEPTSRSVPPRPAVIQEDRWPRWRLS